MPKLIALFALGLAMVIPASAQAHSNLPEPDTYRIKVPVSIGGVKLGMSLKSADKAWGGVGSCGSAVCQYGHIGSDRGDASITSGDGIVAFAIYGDARPNGEYRGSLSRFRTDEGIRLGSRARAVRKAYPRAKPNGNEAFPRLVVRGKDKANMWFGIDGGSVDSIGVSDGK